MKKLAAFFCLSLAMLLGAVTLTTRGRVTEVTAASDNQRRDILRTSWRETPTEVIVTLPAGELTLRQLAANAVRVRFTDGRTPEKPSFVLLPSAVAAPFKVSETATALTVSTSQLRVVFDRATGALSFRDSDGREFLAEKPGSRRLATATVMGEPCVAIEQSFVSPAGERLFGTGQFQDGYLDIRDLPRRLTQVNSQISLPFILSSRGYGLLWHNYGLTDFNPADEAISLAVDAARKIETITLAAADGAPPYTFKETVFIGSFTVAAAGVHGFLLDAGTPMASRHALEIDGHVVIDQRNRWLPPTSSARLALGAGRHTVRVTSSGSAPKLSFRRAYGTTVLRSPVADALDYVVFAGPKADDIIATYRRLTGPAPLLPIWTYGFIQSRDRYSSQRQVVETVDEFRRRALPIDLIVQDWKYWGRYDWNAMQFDEEFYPNPAELVRDVHARHAKIMLSVWSRIAEASVVGKEFKEKGYLLSGSEWIDFFNPDAAALYWKNFNTRLNALGFDAWWLDATEPANDALHGRRVFLGPGDRYRLLYPFFVNGTVYEGLRSVSPDKRVFLFTRCAFLGQQRFATATWSGDVGSDWDAFRRQIPAGLNLAAACLPYWTTDAGGYFRPDGAQAESAAYRETLVRWFEYATFCPLQRVHGRPIATEPWKFGPEVEAAMRRYIELRYRLLPYLYSAAWQVTANGSTLMRPLVMDFADDPAALDRSAQYMFGPAFLVSPVTAPGATSWDVYLPKTRGGWFDFWTGEHLAGGQTVKTAAPLDRIPLHVRAGAILPLGPVKQFAAEESAAPLDLRIYPGADGTYTLYDDDGVSYAYERGQRATITIAWDDTRRVLRVGAREGSYPGMPLARVFRVVIVGAGDTAAGAAKEIRYDGTPTSVVLR